MQVPQVKPQSAATRRNAQYQKRLASILRAASKIIARDGFEGASVRDVAARAKIGLSGIYYYFDSKDEMLFALQHHTFSTLVTTLRERLQQAQSPEARVRAVIDNHFKLFVNNMDDLKVCVHEIESLSGEYYRKVLEVRREYFRLVRSVVAEFVGRSKYKADVATLFLFGALNWVYMWYDAEENADIDKLSDHFMKMFLDGIRS